ncbi:MAG: SRPBCC domain-containing protein [Phenylobacterium sp.]|uniref:SRPBCC domain-containing protein n=1 Tax=Phenylobacterium sp. TaxID=1871053 RepID=UPI0027330C91|nr:SRPBCC domain-containing protein [Phenylobacterium sp.]MDP3173439.1 SRPBCC domain-containing protein [Phenylobacterium sp.]
MPAPVKAPKTFDVAQGFKFQTGGGGPAGVKIEHRIGVNAPASVIWDVIFDVASWPRWSVIYPQAAGEVRIGSALNLTLALPGEAHRAVQATVLDWAPNDQLHLRQSRYGGLLRSTRYLEIEILGDESCIFSNGELFQGLLLSTVRGRGSRSLRKGFTLLGEGLKVRAEAAWRAGGAAPTSVGE